MATSNYQIFLDTLNQLEQDQSLYEAQVESHELEGEAHEEIVKLGGLLAKRLRKFAEKGESYADTLTEEFVPKLTESIQSYQDLIVPPKVCGGFCACLKPARDGPEYEKKLLLTKSKMISSIFVVQAVLIENRGEQHNMDSMHYADYVNKMNNVFNTLQDIKVKGSEKQVEVARKKLLTGSEQVEKFLSHFGESSSKVEFKGDATRRLKMTQELLQPRSTSSTDDPAEALVIMKRTLVKAQSNLQEIMNSAAAIAFTEAKDNLNALDSLAKLLKKVRDSEVQSFNGMEEAMHENNLMDELSRSREYCEVIYSDANSKLRDAIKRWTSIRNQAQPRKVAEYEEEADITGGVGGNMKKIALGNLDLNGADKMFRQPARQISTVGKSLEKMTLGAVSGVTGGMTGVVNEITNIATTGANTVKNVGKKATKVLTGENNESPQNSSHATSAPATTTQKQKSSTLFSGLSSSGNDGEPPKKSGNGFKYNPLDSF